MDKRTKNRISEHQSHGWVEEKRENRIFVSDGTFAPARFMRCPDNAPRNGWFGWIKL